MPFEFDARAALIAGLWALTAAALIWIEILRLRRRQARDERIAAEVTARWHPILSLASFGIRPDTLPPLHKDEQAAFLKLWIYLQTSLRGDARAALSAIATELHCDSLTLRMLARGNRGDRLLATVVAGHLGLVPALRLLMVHAESRDSVLSLQALHSILRISPELAATLAPLCTRRGDRPVSQLLPSLRACSGWLLPPLVAALSDANEAHVERALQLIAGLRLSPDMDVQRRLLAQPSPALLPPLRALLGHGDSRVRAAAVDALARIGNPADIAPVAARLTDASWRVRNSAAHALLALPGGGLDVLRQAGLACGDRYGLNMTEHVLAEHRLAA
ncbi:MAG: HEAT repeat domain-containing protein [Burkholderiaceae bacterium]|nr:HEAT repeat domain-containing protein [Burkholderiaceae bacterium]